MEFLVILWSALAYIEVSCGNHLGYPYWDKPILIILNGRYRLHDVFNKRKS